MCWRFKCNRSAKLTNTVRTAATAKGNETSSRLVQNIYLHLVRTASGTVVDVLNLERVSPESVDYAEDDLDQIKQAKP
jgi:hypothetical protein